MKMIRLGTLRLFLALLAITMIFAACGGGGETSVATGSTSSSVYMLSWEAPDATVDNTAIDPYEELDHYEIYVSADEIFTDAGRPFGSGGRGGRHPYRQRANRQGAGHGLRPGSSPGPSFGESTLRHAESGRDRRAEIRFHGTRHLDPVVRRGGDDHHEESNHRISGAGYLPGRHAASPPPRPAPSAGPPPPPTRTAPRSTERRSPTRCTGPPVPRSRPRP